MLLYRHGNVGCDLFYTKLGLENIKKSVYSNAHLHSRIQALPHIAYFLPPFSCLALCYTQPSFININTFLLILAWNAISTGNWKRPGFKFCTKRKTWKKVNFNIILVHDYKNKNSLFIFIEFLIIPVFRLYFFFLTLTNY